MTPYLVDMQKNKKKTRGRQMSLLGLFSYQLLCVRMNEWVVEFQFLGCFDILFYEVLVAFMWSSAGLTVTCFETLNFKLQNLLKYFGLIYLLEIVLNFDAKMLSFKTRNSQGLLLSWNSSQLSTWAHKCKKDSLILLIKTLPFDDRARPNQDKYLEIRFETNYVSMIYLSFKLIPHTHFEISKKFDHFFVPELETSQLDQH